MSLVNEAVACFIGYGYVSLKLLHVKTDNCISADLKMMSYVYVCIKIDAILLTS